MFVDAKRRAWWGVLTLVALAGSVLVGPAMPATAVDGTVDHPAEYSACIGPATESAGFRDMKGSFAETAADCLAYYGITKGTAVGVYSPNDAIPRWQMALFLARAAGPTGIVLPTPSDQGFTDLSVGSDTRDAINQLAALGIMNGTSETTFSPLAPVIRQQMALLLSRFLRAAPTGPGGTDLRSITPDDDVFTDLYSVSLTAYRAIREIYEVGVTIGTSASTFSPDARVSRAQMAVFVARMLAHTNARPAGLSVQMVDTVVFKESEFSLAISLRDTDQQPFEDVYFDVFRATDPTKAFDENGSCTDHISPTAGGNPCTIDISDPVTDSLGNVLVDVDVGNVKSLWLWIWTGEKGKLYDNDTEEPTVLNITTRSGATALEVTDDLPPAARMVRFGESVTFTFQMVDEDNDPVARSGVSFTIRVRESRDNGRRFERSTISKETGPDGGTQLTFRFTDPSSSPGDVARLDFDVQSSSGFKVKDSTTIRLVKDDRTTGDPFLDWADEQPEPTTLKLTLPKEYRVASSDGAGAGAIVRAALTDQYGGPVVREQVVFTSNDRNGVPSGVRRSTSSAGVATLTYQRDDPSDGIETITARFNRLQATARQYWVMPVSGSAGGSGSIRVIDTDSNTVVVASGNNAVLIEYDGNDHYQVDDGAVTIAAFEGQMTLGDILAYEIINPAEATVNTYTLTNR